VNKISGIVKNKNNKRRSDAYQHFTVPEILPTLNLFAPMTLHFGSGAQIGQACFKHKI